MATRPGNGYGRTSSQRASPPIGYSPYRRVQSLRTWLCPTHWQLLVNEEISRSGHQTREPLELPEISRAAYLDDWYKHNRIKPPSKRAIASRALEIAAGSPTEPGSPLLEKRHRTALAKLHKSLLRALGACPQCGQLPTAGH